jgi:MoxR-like ATPase
VDELYGPRFLIERPLLRAVRAGSSAVLLVDELDRADDEFEAFLLEILADFAVTVPEIGTIRADQPPAVIITSNRTRELHDALKRRCLYHWIDYPDLERETAIVRARAPEVDEALARQVARAVEKIRTLDLVKKPGPAESIDWSRAVAAIGLGSLEAETARLTLGWVIKNKDDMEVVEQALPEILG